MGFCEKNLHLDGNGNLAGPRGHNSPRGKSESPNCRDSPSKMVRFYILVEILTRKMTVELALFALDKYCRRANGRNFDARLV